MFFSAINYTYWSVILHQKLFSCNTLLEEFITQSFLLHLVEHFIVLKLIMEKLDIEQFIPDQTDREGSKLSKMNALESPFLLKKT